MKNNKKLSDAIGQIDQKYIDEYMNGQASRRPLIWRTVIAATLAVTLLVGAVIGIPMLTRDGGEIGDGQPQLTFPENEDGTFLDGEYITGADGTPVFYMSGIYSASGSYYESGDKTASTVEIAIDWASTLNTAINDPYPDTLIFIGRPVSADTYFFDKEVPISGWLVEYDVASGTTAIKPADTKVPEIKTQRIFFTVRAVEITEILKKNNTTGYNVGDTVYIYSSYGITLDDGNTGTSNIEQYSPDSAVSSPYAPMTLPAEASSGAYIPATTVPETEIATAVVEQGINLDINGDGKIDKTDLEAMGGNAQTEDNSGEMLYIVNSDSSNMRDDVKATGIVPEDVWFITATLSASKYRSGKYY